MTTPAHAIAPLVLATEPSLAEATEGQIATANRTLASLNLQAQVLRADLAGLRQSLAEVQHDLNGNRVAQLIKTNARLVLEAQDAETAAATAASDFGELTRSSQRDALTDTPNRTLMLDRLEGAITLAQRRGTCMAVLFVDLDHFKQINDSLGHAIGDEVLQWVARCLESAVRESDTVSRHGGDEFLVLLTEVSHPLDVALIASKMLSSLAKPVLMGSAWLHLSASIGVAIYPEHGSEAATLIARADAAMYRAKRSGGGIFEFG